MKKIAKLISALLVVTILLSACNFTTAKATRLEITNDDYLTINVGEILLLEVDTDFMGELTWFSDEQNFATVDGNGIVTGVAEGTALITVSGGGLVDIVTVKVTGSKTELTLTSPAETLEIGQTVTLSATVMPGELANQIELRVADGSEFVTLDGYELTGVKQGKAVIVAQVDGVVASTTVEVVPSRSVSEIHLSASSQTEKVGQSVELTVEGVPSDLLPSVKFVVSEGIATVTGNSLTSTVVGSVSVYATYGNIQSNVVTLEFEQGDIVPQSITISIGDADLFVGDKTTLSYTAIPSGSASTIDYYVTEGQNCVSIVGNRLEAVAVGTVTIYGEFCGVKSNYLTIIVRADIDPYVGMSETTFYKNYKPATSYKDSYYRTLHNFMSGSLATQPKIPTTSSVQPSYGGKLLKNTANIYGDNGNSYTVLDYNGNQSFTVFKGGAYVTLDEVAAYVKAFGNIPANYDSDKNNKSSSNDPWGKYLRLNHSRFYNDVNQYPREPLLPQNGAKSYFEMDIGIANYNNGNTIKRLTARIVYARFAGSSLIGNANERYVFYTYNHYEDFQEYLNYQGGWGKRFGFESNNYITPSQYVEVNLYDFTLGTSQSQINSYFQGR